MNPPTRLPEPGQYAVRVAGRLEQRWADWFDGLTLTYEVDGTTVLHGRVADQAALHGLLHKIRDLGLPLLSVTPVTADTTSGHSAEHDVDASTPTPTTPTTRSSS